MDTTSHTITLRTQEGTCKGCEAFVGNDPQCSYGATLKDGNWTPAGYCPLAWYAGQKKNAAIACTVTFDPQGTVLTF